MNGPLLTVAELAQRFRVRPETIRHWARLGRVPCLRCGPRSLRFDLQAVEHALQQRGRLRSTAITKGGDA